MWGNVSGGEEKKSIQKKTATEKRLYRRVGTRVVKRNFGLVLKTNNGTGSRERILGNNGNEKIAAVARARGESKNRQ